MIRQCEEKKCYFSHPMDQTMKIFVFADVPHLMKLARNNLFDSGFFIDGKLITKDILEDLVTLNSGELKIAFNLTKVHLDAKGNQRQSVKLAAQVFSRRNAKAIEYCAKEKLLTNENWQETANLLQLFNDWFDILNCHSKFENRKGIKTYGVELEQQDAILNKMSEVISSMRSPKRSTILPFQKGILLSTESLRQLLRYVKDKYSTDEYNIQYIITRRLNQDILENFFYT